MKSPESIHIRLLEEGAPPSIAAAFQNMGWNKPEGQYRQYLHEQVAGTPARFVATVFRRKGIASRLLDRAEAEAARHSAVMGIGVGLHPGYNAAQQLYVKRGYILDGRGITYRDHFVDEGAHR